MAQVPDVIVANGAVFEVEPDQRRRIGQQPQFFRRKTAVAEIDEAGIPGECERICHAKIMT
jgi:hypothetical protein